MRARFASILAVAAHLGGLLPGSQARQKAAGKTDREQLQGEWITLSGETGGKKVEKDVVDHQTYEFKGDVLIIKYKGLAPLPPRAVGGYQDSGQGPLAPSSSDGRSSSDDGQRRLFQP
jgi:hypothetical protein